MSNEAKLPKVLVVEDNWRYQKNLATELQGKAETIQAYTIDEGREKFRENQAEIVVIVMDACVPGHEPNTPPLVREIRDAGFRGPMIAVSSAELYRETLMRAGCDVDGGYERDRIPEIVTTVLERAKTATAAIDNSAVRPVVVTSVPPSGTNLGSGK